MNFNDGKQFMNCLTVSSLPGPNMPGILAVSWAGPGQILKRHGGPLPRGHLRAEFGAEVDPAQVGGCLPGHSIKALPVSLDWKSKKAHFLGTLWHPPPLPPVW